MTDETQDFPNIKLNGVRVSFPKFFVKNPKNRDGDTVKPGATWLLHPQDNAADIAKCNKAIEDILGAKNKGKKLEASKYFLRDGDLSGRGEYEGYMIASTNTRTPTTLPRVMDAGKRIVKSEDDLDDFYSGIYCNVLVSPWWQDNKHGKRVNAELLAVQVLKGGEALASGGVTEEVALSAFNDEGDDEEDF